MNAQHRDLASGRWLALSLAEQLGNIGSEYERALKWKNNNDARFETAFSRFLELLDLTTANQQLTAAQRRELIRVRETACEELTGEMNHDDYFQKYFYYFALAARGHR